jgi:Raf kinase inhibitor-like YbhB/YbcL family protein
MKGMTVFVIGLSFILLTLLTSAQEAFKMEIISPSIKQGGTIPTVHTCDGTDISPALSWTGVPEGAKSLVLIVDDPDAPMGTWAHWILYNLPPETTGLPENIQELPVGTRRGETSFRYTHYGGPCPPDREHRYYFKLYALDSLIDLPEGAKQEQVEKAMEGHQLAKAVLMGRYNRPQNMRK